MLFYVRIRPFTYKVSKIILLLLSSSSSSIISNVWLLDHTRNTCTIHVCVGACEFNESLFSLVSFTGSSSSNTGRMSKLWAH